MSNKNNNKKGEIIIGGVSNSKNYIPCNDSVLLSIKNQIPSDIEKGVLTSIKPPVTSNTSNNSGNINGNKK